MKGGGDEMPVAREKDFFLPLTPNHSTLTV
jgi:hypothetical protein